MQPTPQITGRLAPTPSGKLHLGNACAFAAAWLSVRSQHGQLLLRFEDVDTTRARLAIEDSQRRDLEWLGLTWDREVTRQSERDYAPAIAHLGAKVYFCECTRAIIREAGGVHPKQCRERRAMEGSLRLMLPETTVTFHDRRWGQRTVNPSALGDPVLRRRDGVYAYPLAVVADDIADGVTEVVRGADLLDYSALQLVLWGMLAEGDRRAGPTWMHSPMIVGNDGRKLSKSNGSLNIGELREAGWSPSDVWRLLLPVLGIAQVVHLDEAIPLFQPDHGPLGPLQLANAGGLGPGTMSLRAV